MFTQGSWRLQWIEDTIYRLKKYLSRQQKNSWESAHSAFNFIFLSLFHRTYFNLLSYFSLFHCFDSTSQIKRLCWALAHSLHSSTKSNFHLKTSTSQVERLGWATHRRQCAYKLSHSLDKLRKHPSIQCPKYTFLQMKNYHGRILCL